MRLLLDVVKRAGAGRMSESCARASSLPASGRHDKLIDKGRVAIFMGYEPTTSKQYRIYTPDLGYIMRTSVVNFDELIPRGDVDLCI